MLDKHFYASEVTPETRFRAGYFAKAVILAKKTKKK